MNRLIDRFLHQPVDVFVDGPKQAHINTSTDEFTDALTDLSKDEPADTPTEATTGRPTGTCTDRHIDRYKQDPKNARVHASVVRLVGK